MGNKFKGRLKVGSLLFGYSFALYQAGSDIEKIGQVNENFDARAAMMSSASGTSSPIAVVGGAQFIDLTPYTVVDKQFFNSEADYMAKNGGRIWGLANSGINLNSGTTWQWPPPDKKTDNS